MFRQHFTELRECCVRMIGDELADFFFVKYELGFETVLLNDASCSVALFDE